jgi:hypothetical protein
MRYTVLVTAAVLVTVSIAATLAAAPTPDGKVIELPPDIRAKLDKYVGRGVVGKALPAEPIGDINEFLGLNDDVKWRYRWVHGPHKGKTSIGHLTRLERTSKAPRWKLDTGVNTVIYAVFDDAGNFVSPAGENHDQGVISRFDPPEPIFYANMQPGEKHEFRIGVTVFDLADPGDVEHRGHLDLTYEYVGAYEVNVPAGKFDAILLRWHYKGKVGPAKVEDLQYYFYAKGIGPVCKVNKSNISAFLVYNDRSKNAAVLLSREN